jgi:DNA polymerase-3 subunit gamma/tau
MLSGGAFNALLKTLEEPPANVVFILATTEVHKIPETILSRVQRFDFTRLTVEEIIDRLAEIAKLEKVKIDQEALEIIASSSEGGMRNAESLLGQIIALEDKKITAKEVEFILSTASEKFTANFVGLIVTQRFPEAFSKIGELRETGVDFRNFGKSLLNYFRQMLILKINPDLGKKLLYEMTKERLRQIQDQIANVETENILNFITILQENSDRFKSSPIPQLFLEMSIARLAAKKGKAEDKLRISSSPARGEVTEGQMGGSTNPPKSSAKKDEEKKIVKTENSDSTPAEKPKNKPVNSADIDFVLTNWQNIIESLKDYNHSLSSVLKMCQPAMIDGKHLILKTKYSFYNDKINENQNRLTIEEAIDRITGVNLRLKPLTEKEYLDQYGKTPPDKSLLQEAVEIFGGQIVDE